MVNVNRHKSIIIRICNSTNGEGGAYERNKHLDIVHFHIFPEKETKINGVEIIQLFITRY